MQTIVLGLVMWIVPPAIMLAVFAYALVIRSRPGWRELKESANAGLLAGLVLFAIIVVTQLNAVKDLSFELPELLELRLVLLPIGFALGFGFLWGLKFVRLNRAVGIVVLLMTAASWSSLYSYVFIESTRGTLLMLSLGVALGALVYRAFFPPTNDS